MSSLKPLLERKRALDMERNGDGIRRSTAADLVAGMEQITSTKATAEPFRGD